MGGGNRPPIGQKQWQELQFSSDILQENLGLDGITKLLVLYGRGTFIELVFDNLLFAR